ncbi:MAG: hypothetical protein GF307_08215 [candidate division Zixibacteria bacterium]|nr:hypothetical protein [candidate division Zixibacteria bacterium]
MNHITSKKYPLIFILLTVLAISFTSCGNGGNNDENKTENAQQTTGQKGLTWDKKDFRNVTWHSSKDDIRRAETEAEFVEEKKTPYGDRLTYNGKVAGLECTISYYFIRDELTQAGYEILSDGENFTEQEVIDKFNTLKERIEASLGETSEYMDARKAGIFRIAGRWHTSGGTEIGLLANKAGTKYRIVLNYKSPEQQTREEAVTEQRKEINVQRGDDTASGGK